MEEEVDSRIIAEFVLYRILVQSARVENCVKYNAYSPSASVLDLEASSESKA